jgi:hypothetical protein
VGIRCSDHAAPSIRKKLALTSPTSGCLSVGTVRSRTKATEFVLFRYEDIKVSGGMAPPFQLRHYMEADGQLHALAVSPPGKY